MKFRIVTVLICAFGAVSLMGCPPEETRTDAGDGDGDGPDPCLAHVNLGADGVDDDDDTPLCGDDGIVAGDVVVRGPATITALSGCTRITGELVIASRTLTSLAGLESLTEIEGDLHIGNIRSAPLDSDTPDQAHGNIALTSVDGLSGLTHIGGSLIIGGSFEPALPPDSNDTSSANLFLGNGALTNLDGLSALTTVDGDVRLGGSQNEVLVADPFLTCLGNPMLTDIEGLRNLATIGGGFIIGQHANYGAAMEGFEEFEVYMQTPFASLPVDWALSSVADIFINGRDLVAATLSFPATVSTLDNLYFYSSTTVTDVSFPGLLSAQSISIANADGLLAVDSPMLDSSARVNLEETSFLTLEEFGPLGDGVVVAEVDLRDNDLLLEATIGAEITTRLRMERNPHVTTLAVTSASQLEEISIVDNASLVSLDGLQNVGALELHVEGNAGLTSLEGVGLLGDNNPFDFPFDIYSLRIVDNDALTSLAGLEAVDAFSATEIRGNDALLSLDGLTPTETVGSTVITENTLLPQCAVDAWFAQYCTDPQICFFSPESSVGNDEDAVCD